MTQTINLPDDHYLTPLQLYQFTGTPPGTWANMRCKGSGPPFIRIGRSIRYRVKDVREWIERQNRKAA